MNAFQYKFQIIQNRNHCTAEQDSAKWKNFTTMYIKQKSRHWQCKKEKIAQLSTKTEMTTTAVQNGNERRVDLSPPRCSGPPPPQVDPVGGYTASNANITCHISVPIFSLILLVIFLTNASTCTCLLFFC